MSNFLQCLVCIAVFMAQINAVDLSQRPPENSDYLERAERVYIEERLGEQSFLTQDTLHQTFVYSDNEDDDKCYYATTQCAKLCHKVPNVVWMYASCDKTCSQITMEDVMEDMSFSITHNLSWYSTKDMTELVESENVMCCTCLSRSSMTSWQRGLLALSVVVGIIALLVVVFRIAKSRKSNHPTHVPLLSEKQQQSVEGQEMQTRRIIRNAEQPEDYQV